MKVAHIAHTRTMERVYAACHRSSKTLLMDRREHTLSLVRTISTMPKVFIFSPAPITRRKLSRVISYKEPRAIRFKPTLLFQRKRKRFRLFHGYPMLTTEQSHSDIPSTRASALAERTNTFHRDSYPKPYRRSPTVLRRRKQSPPLISFQLSSRKTSLQTIGPNVLQLPSSQDKKPFSKPSCKEVTCSHQPRPRNDSATLREWIACIILGFVLRGDQHNRPRLYVDFLSFDACHLSEFRRLEAVAAVAANIKRLFEIYSLHDEMIFLALWYASRIMPEGILDQFYLYQPDGIVLATRLFVLSYTLAIKWLSDETYSLQNWYVLRPSTYRQANVFLIRVPHYQKGFSISSAKALDKAALELLEYDLYISPFQWTTWLHKLDQVPSANILMEDRVHLVAQARIRNLLFKLDPSNPSSRSRSISTSVTSVWKVHMILLDNLAISVPFPEPAPWNPAEDPIIHTTGRRQPMQTPSPWSCGNHCYSASSRRF